MEAFVKLLDPWCRELCGVIEAVPVGDERWSRDMWELRVQLPQQSKYSPQQWGRRMRTTPSIEVKLQHIREGLDLLWLVRSMGESAWMWLLVHCCGVGGFDHPLWTDDARVLPRVQLQPPLVETIEDIVETIEHCHYLLVTLQDESTRSQEFKEIKHKLQAVAKTTRSGSYSVRLGNWMSPSTLLSATESKQMWEKLMTMVRAISTAPPLEQTPCWMLESVNLQLLRSVLSFDAAVGLLELATLNVRIEELKIDLLDRADDELTASGFASVLTKLFSGSMPPRYLSIDCENASRVRLEHLTRILESATAPIDVMFERFGLMPALPADEHVELFKHLGVCLRQPCITSIRLDIPTLSFSQLTAVAIALTNGERSTALSSLVLTTDCHRESWQVIEKLLHLVGKNLESLEIGIHGDLLSDKAPKAIVSLCPNLKRLKLHRVQLLMHSPLIAHLRQSSSRLRSLSLPRLCAPLEVVNELSRTIADPKYPCFLESLHLDLSEIPNVCDEIVSAISSAVRTNNYMCDVTLVLESDAAAAVSDPVHDDFYRLHNERIVQPLHARHKLAFLSVFKTTINASLSQLPLTLIFDFAGSQSRRRVIIREPSMPW